LWTLIPILCSNSPSAGDKESLKDAVDDSSDSCRPLFPSPDSLPRDSSTSSSKLREIPSTEEPSAKPNGLPLSLRPGTVHVECLQLTDLIGQDLWLLARGADHLLKSSRLSIEELTLRLNDPSPSIG